MLEQKGRLISISNPEGMGSEKYFGKFIKINSCENNCFFSHTNRFLPSGAVPERASDLPNISLHLRRLLLIRHLS